MIAALVFVTVWNLESLHAALPIFSHWTSAECLGSQELGRKHGMKFHTVKQCLKVKVLAERGVFNKHMVGHSLTIFETRVKIRVMKKASAHPWPYLVLDWMKVISLSLCTGKRKKKKVSEEIHLKISLF